MEDIHTSFKSRVHRLGVVADVRAGKIGIFNQIEAVPESPLLELKIKAPFLQGVTLEPIYRRKETRTIVYKVHTQDHVLILKLYALPTPIKLENAEDETILNHEIEIRYLKVFADLVQRAVCPHFTLPIGHTVMTEKQTQQLFPDFTPIKPGKYMMILSECGDTTLNKLIRGRSVTPYQIAALIFQVVLSLHVVHNIFPSFRHNDLHLSNVLVQTLDQNPLQESLNSKCLYVKYMVNDQKYYVNVSQCPYRALIWDMYYSSIDQEDAEKYGLKQVVPRKKQLFVSNSSKSTRSCQNQYFDLHKFFDSLEYVLKKEKKKTQVTQELWDLIDIVVPSHLKCMSKGLTHKDKTEMRLWEAKHITPAEILQHSYFDIFKHPDPDRRVIREYKYPPIMRSKE